MTSAVLLVLAVFAASAVEMVEALTIVLAAGVSRGWRSALEGAGAALLALAVVVAAFGPALVRYVPLDVLRVVVGGLLLILGLQWLRKAILRASGHKALHDEDAIYRRQVQELSGTPKATGRRRDATAFTVAFKGVLLEGLEVVMIVLTLGTTSGRLGLAAAGAAAAALAVGLAGLVLARRLVEVPENTLKMVVGIMLVSFGTFWTGEGMGVDWPGTDLSILGLIALYGAVTFGLIASLRRARVRVGSGGQLENSVEVP
ncbi:MAG TPA: hypothetical protein VGF64_13010 [Acidimicrobiales bacterium]|jgi:uncharacterized membrane protein